MSVCEIPKDELISRAIRSFRPVRKRGGVARWIKVMDLFSLGSTYAHELCRLHGCDPNEMVRR